ncbi:hypothetical protein FHX73_115261 [Kitasatospora viridis]|uniref:Uncharacterized protein n=1 Tax=Kitasatospora viridis TaxID=281105 RepID=A0A561UPR7_9ACTN|nr:hypothetical protein FHX73_115261 [Kitasatospora viridis]
MPAHEEFMPNRIFCHDGHRRIHAEAELRHALTAAGFTDRNIHRTAGAARRSSGSVQQRFSAAAVQRTRSAKSRAAQPTASTVSRPTSSRLRQTAGSPGCPANSARMPCTAQ